MLNDPSDRLRALSGARHSLGMIYKQQEQPQQALECLQAICDQPPPPLSQADVWYLIGSLQETMEPAAPDFAKQAYEHVLRLMQMSNDPKVARVYRQLGWVCHHWKLDAPLVAPIGMNHQIQQAPIVCLQHALQTDPADAANWHLFARCLLDHNEVDGAYDCLMHAVQLEPANSEIWATVGSVYMANGQAADAVTAFEHAVHLQPSSPAWYELGIARHNLLTSADTPVQPEAITAALEAYTRALSICTGKREDISARLELIQTLRASSSMPVTSATGSENAVSSGNGDPTPPLRASCSFAVGGVAQPEPAVVAVELCAQAVLPASASSQPPAQEGPNLTAGQGYETGVPPSAAVNAEGIDAGDG
jgi:tetratricopeptide (TPR) repeat protein